MIAIGLILTFWKGIEDYDFLYIFDGKRKKSTQWRRIKRIGIGLIFLIGGLVSAWKIFISD